VCSRNKRKYWPSWSLNGRPIDGWYNIIAAFGVLGVIGGVVRRWIFASRLEGSCTGSWFGGGALAAAAAIGFGAILISSNGLALRGGGG